MPCLIKDQPTGLLRCGKGDALIIATTFLRDAQKMGAFLDGGLFLWQDSPFYDLALISGRFEIRAGQLNGRIVISGCTQTAHGGGYVIVRRLHIISCEKAGPECLWNCKHGHVVIFKSCLKIQAHFFLEILGIVGIGLINQEVGDTRNTQIRLPALFAQHGRALQKGRTPLLKVAVERLVCQWTA